MARRPFSNSASAVNPQLRIKFTKFKRLTHSNRQELKKGFFKLKYSRYAALLLILLPLIKSLLKQVST